MLPAPVKGLWLWTWRKIIFTSWRRRGETMSLVLSKKNIHGAWKRSSKQKKNNASVKPENCNNSKRSKNRCIKIKASPPSKPTRRRFCAGPKSSGAAKISRGVKTFNAVGGLEYERLLFNGLIQHERGFANRDDGILFFCFAVSSVGTGGFYFRRWNGHRDCLVRHLHRPRHRKKPAPHGRSNCHAGSAIHERLA